MKNLNVLVIEDTEEHQISARETLEAHPAVKDLDVIGRADEGFEVFRDEPSDYWIFQLLKKEGLRWGDDKNLERRLRETESERFSKNYQVVLTDLMLPMLSFRLGPGKFNPCREIPYGMFLAIRAAQAGVTHIAVISDTNHHDAPEAAALDHFGKFYPENIEILKKRVVRLGQGRALFAHAPMTEERRKNWGRVLTDLLRLEDLGY